MANPDRPRGFTPVRHKNGGSWNNALAERAMIDAVEFAVPTATWKIGIGTPVIATDEVADTGNSAATAHLKSVKPMTAGDTTGGEVGVYGVVVGIGNLAAGDTLTGEGGPYDPDLLGGPNFVTDTEVTADPDKYVLYIAPAKDWIFEVQNNAAVTLQNGTIYALSVADDEAEQIDPLTGRSIVEVAAAGNNFRMVDLKESPNNDFDTANATMLGMFVDPFAGVAESQ